MAKPDRIKELRLFKRRIGPGRRIFGLDLGTKQIGIALSDLSLTIASSHSMLKKKKFTETAEALFDLMEKNQVDGLVIGLPLEMSGKEGPRAQSAREFGRNLLKLRDIPILFVDERLSTSAVENVLIEADRSRARRAEVVDKMAAAFFLQGALDTLIEMDDPDAGGDDGEDQP